jgi:hypothetical protein
MAKAYSGRDGQLLIDGTTQIKVTNWSIQADAEMLEITTLGDNQRSYTPGVQGFTGSATLLYYKDDTDRNDAATLLKKVIKTAGISNTDTVDLRLRFVDGTITNDIRMTAYVTSVSTSVGVGEVSSAQINFQATGALTAVTL